MIHESWVNILGKNGYQEFHNHAHCFGSGVLYLTDDNSSIEFAVFPDDIRKQIVPKKCDLLLFDSSTFHRVLESDKDTIASMLEGLGMKNVRAHRIWRMSEEYLTWDGEDATELFGIGKYGSDSYEIFYKNRMPDNVQDKELKRYIKEEKNE